MKPKSEGDDGRKHGAVRLPRVPRSAAGLPAARWIEPACSISEGVKLTTAQAVRSAGANLNGEQGVGTLGDHRRMYFGSPSGPTLTREQARELDDEFFQSRPLDYFYARIGSIISSSDKAPASQATALGAEFSRALGVGDASSVLIFDESSQGLQQAIDSFAVRHHAAEALARLYHAMTVTADPADAAPCVWAGIADG